MPIKLSKLNTKPRSGFTLDLIAVFEFAPWIAQEAWDRRPFASVERLYLALLEALNAAKDEKKLELLGKQDELVARSKRYDERADDWDRGRAKEVLGEMNDEEQERFAILNAAYAERFGFPFVIDLRTKGKSGVLAALAERAENDPATELEAALAQLAQIARYRLERTVTPR